MQWLTRGPMNQTPQQRVPRHRRRCTGRGLTLSALPLVALLASDPVPASTPAAEAGARDAALESEAEARQNLLADVRDYQHRIAELETRGGAYANGLAEQLLGLGLALQRNGAHGEAIETFKRGVHLTRINEGLYSDRQMAMLQGEIASHIAQGEYSVADERQRYLYRIQTQALTDVTRAQAFMHHARWQRKAYEADLGDAPFSRLINMFSLHRLALTELVNVEGEDSPLLLEPLYGMLQAQYLLSGFVGETSSGHYRTGGVFSDEQSMQMSYRNESYKQGNAEIRAIYDVSAMQPEFDLEHSANTLILQGDWKLWHGKRGEAMAVYGEIFGELAARDADQAIVDSLFGVPVPLPAIEGVRTLPPRIEEREGALLLEFGVSERGRVTDLVRVDNHPSNDDSADSIMRRFRQTLFRPRISDGMPVETQGLRWAYDTADW